MKKWLVGLALAVILLVPAVASAFSVTLAWESSPSPDASEYIIHWGTESGVYTQSVSVGYDLTGIITNLIDGDMYYFAVSCKDIEGEESGYSNEVFSDGVNIVPDGNPPLAPGGCYIVAVSP